MDVVFRDCPIDLASFRFGRLKRVRFDGCPLLEADFQGVTAEACTFIDCDLTGAQLSHANFTGSAFRGCRLAGVNGVESLKGAHWHGKTSWSSPTRSRPRSGSRFATTSRDPTEQTTKETAGLGKYRLSLDVMKGRSRGDPNRTRS